MSVSRMVRMSVEYECSFGFLAFVEEIATSLETSIDGLVTQTWHSDTVCAVDVGGTRIGAAYEDASKAPEGVPCLTLSLGKNDVDTGPCLLRDNRDDFLYSVQRLLAEKGKVETLSTADFNAPFSPTTLQEMRSMTATQTSSAAIRPPFTETPMDQKPGTRVVPRRVTAQAGKRRDRCVRLGTVHLNTKDNMTGQKAKLYSNGSRLVKLPDTHALGEEAICKWALRSATDPVSQKTATTVKHLTRIAAVTAAAATFGHAAAAATLATFGA
ncbi:MAG: hypothetical protein AAGI10_12135 [Pseudomonadota bacterium]